MEGNESKMKVAFWLQKLPFVIRADRGKEETEEIGYVNRGLESETDLESSGHNYLHITDDIETSDENERQGPITRVNGNCSGDYTWSDRLRTEDDDARLDFAAAQLPTLTEERIHRNIQAAEMNGVNSRAQVILENLDIAALNMGEPAGLHAEKIGYFRGIEMNEFPEEDVRYVSWKNVIIKNKGLITSSVILIIIVIIIMSILITLVAHDHIPSHSGD